MGIARSGSGARIVGLVVGVLLVAGCGTAGTDPAATGDSAQVRLPDIVLPGDLWGPWRLQPIAVSAEVRAAAEAACRRSMDPFPPAPLVVLDARGEGFLHAQFANAAGGAATCIDMVLNRDGTVDALGGGSTGMGGVPFRALAPFELESQGSMGSGGGPNGAVTSSLLSGRTGVGISSVVIDMPGKGRMTASHANGWYLAWYPGDWPAGSKVRALDITGAVVAELTP